MLMRSHDRAVEHRYFFIRLLIECLDDAIPYAQAAPVGKAFEDTVPRTLFSRQITSWTDSCQDVKYSVDKSSGVLKTTTQLTCFRRKQGADTLVLLV
jgi:hypothetical protein